MRTLIATASLLLAASPWILPSIAAAAKLGQEEARNQQTLHGCIEAKLAGKPWPPQ